MLMWRGAVSSPWSRLSDVPLISLLLTCRRKNLADSQDLEHEREAVREQLLRVLVLMDAAEVFEEALDERPAVLHEAGPQGLQPGVEGPGNAWETPHGE